MQQRIVLVFVGCLLAVGAAWADPPSSGTTANAPAPAVARVNQHVAQGQAEIQHLQQDVGQQESASRQAAERLQQQDHTIAELREQLKAAQQASKTPPTPAAGH